MLKEDRHSMPIKPGAKAIIVNRGEILLVLRDDIPTIPHPGKWNTPGGGIENGETPKEGLVRELEEEVCLVPSSVIEMGTTTYPDGSVVHRFYVPVTDEERTRIKLGEEGQKICWFTFEQVLHMGEFSDQFVYFRTHIQDILDISNENFDSIPRHDEGILE